MSYFSRLGACVHMFLLIRLPSCPSAALLFCSSCLPPSATHVELTRSMRVNRFDSPMITAEKILGKDLASRIKPLWNVDAEGEIRTAWRDSGVPNFWFVMGNLMMCRFHSKHLALRECLVWYLSPC